MDISGALPCVEGGVRVRRLEYRDVQAFADGTEDAAVRAYGHLPLSNYTAEIVRHQIDGVIADGLADGSLAVLAIADTATDEFLGSVVLFDITATRAEVGFWLTPAARGRGVAQQALRAAIRLAAHAGLSTLDARTVPENEGSIRVLKSQGFVQTGGPQQAQTPSGETLTALTFERSTR
ncbi:GNAT family N-acetyltransferase [Nocardia sp. NPDC050406]|uniref:GNAT family N-acetyltransferase n=1 Tax=Nocardia sp. NPDC050406 TaxID=3364318 RepID=UPI0037B436EE